MKKWFKNLAKEHIFPHIHPLSWIGSRDLRNRLREAGLSFRSSLPRFLMINRGDTVVEVGTPFPGTMRELSANVGPKGEVIIVEPAPENIERLKEAKISLPNDNVKLVEKAAWDKSDTLHLQLAAQPDDHKFNLSNIEHDAENRPKNTYQKSTSVHAETLDKILENIGHTTVNYATIAVNGAEMKVLRGAARLLRQSRNLRLFVKGHARLESGAPINQPVREFLENLGFRTRVTWIGESTAGNHHSWVRRAGNIFAYIPKCADTSPES